MKPGRFYGVGVGPGNPELITLKAARVLSTVPVIFVPRKGQESASVVRGIISGLVRDGQEIVELIFPMVKDKEKLAAHWQRAAESIWQRLEQGRDCALVNLGDPLLYGTFIHVMNVLRREYPELEIEVIPGTSSINAAAARALVPLAVENDRVAVLPGDSDDEFVKETLRNFETVVFMKVNHAFDRLLGILDELGMVEKCVYVKKCTNQDELVVTDVRTLKGQKLDYFSLLIVKEYSMAVQVYFIGAGPGDPELITLKGKRLIERADVIIYADSLISPEILKFARADAEIHGSAALTLEQTTSIIVEAVKQAKMVARLHSGDPSIFGAIGEQMAALDEKGIEYEVVPGVSSLFAAAAALKAELTVPELSQTVIITRMEGRTSVPTAESLRTLAAHQASLAIFLSVSMVEEVVGELVAGGYPPDIPAAVVYRASWPDEKVIRTTLGGLAGQVRQSGIKKQALILVGSFLGKRAARPYSKLYDKDFKHGYR